MALRSSSRSYSHDAASHAHHHRCVEDHRRETVISIIDLAALQADTDRPPWVDHVEGFPHADVLDRRLVDTTTDIRAEEGAGVVEEASEAVETIETVSVTDLDAPCPALGLVRLGEAHRTHGHVPGAHHAAVMVVITGGGSLLTEVELVVVDAAQATAPMAAIVGVEAGVGAGDAGLPGDRRPSSCVVGH